MWKLDVDEVSDIFCRDSEIDSLPMDSERVMKEIQRLYRTKELGLKDAAKALGEKNFHISMPQNKITVLMVGHHNPAKQKFLDLYFSETRQPEPGGFTSKVNYDKLDKIFITHGNQRRMLTGETVLDYCPHLAQLKNIPGIKENLTTEIASRNTKSLVSFILAPDRVSDPPMPISDTVDDGWVDTNTGTLQEITQMRQRSMDARQAILKLTEAADLVFLFFDPTGNNSPAETLRPFEYIWEAYYDRILLVLAKASCDECTEEVREQVLAQVVREIWRNPAVRRVGYLPEIYCPDLTSGIRDDERLWQVIQNTADQSVDKALAQLGKDATCVKEKLEARLEANAKAKDSTTFSVYFWITLVVTACFAIWLVRSTRYCDELMCKLQKLVIWGGKWPLINVGLFMVLMIFMLMLDKTSPALSETEERLLNRRLRFVNHALARKEIMEKKYIGMNFN